MSILNVENLTHGFGDRAIFNNVSFRLLKGEHIGLIGANGEGKSTFMNIVTGKLMPDEGNVEWNKNEKTVVLSGDISDSSDVTPLLGFYMSMENASENLQSTYIDFTTPSKRSLFANTAPTSSDGLCFSATLAQQYQKLGQGIEKRYSVCKSKGLVDDSDFEMLIEFRRLNEKAISILGGQVERTVDYQIPGTDVTHRLVFIKKIKETPKKYPSAFAKIKKNPL